MVLYYPEDGGIKYLRKVRSARLHSNIPQNITISKKSPPLHKAIMTVSVLMTVDGLIVYMNLKLWDEKGVTHNNKRRVGVRVPVGSRIFASPHRPYRFWGPPSLLSNEYPWLFRPGVNWLGREADHLPPSSVPRSRKRGSLYPLPHTPPWRSA
jgi:hypothetical protein